MQHIKSNVAYQTWQHFEGNVAYQSNAAYQNLDYMHQIIFICNILWIGCIVEV
jgi:hypothetical protein